VKLNAELSPGGVIGLWEIAPGGERVVYTADVEADGIFELFSVPLAGGSAPVKLNGLLGATADVFWFKVSPDGEQVAFTADQATDDEFELHSVPIDGSAPSIQLSGTLSPGYIWGPNQFDFSSDSERLVYATDGDRVPFNPVNEPIELYAVPTDGSAAPVQLSGPLASGGSVRLAGWGMAFFSFNGRGTRIAYVADQEADERIELYGSVLPRIPRAQLGR
jgi:Tol biopolymer transport system component